MTKNRLPRFAFASFAVLVLGTLSGCTGGGATTPAPATETAPAKTAGGRAMPTATGNTVTGDTIPIGVVASENGELKPWGDDELKGAQLAVEEANAAGGVHGKQIKLLIGDSGSKPEVGKSATEKLISDGAIGVVGEVASGITAQIAQVCFEKGVPDVAVGATRTDLSDTGGTFFRVCYIDDFQGPVMATFAYNELNLRKVAIITDNKQPYSQGLSASFGDFFKKLGGEIVDQEFYDSGQTQFSGQLTNLKAQNPDGIFMSGYFTEVGPLIRQAHDLGIDAKMLGGDGWDSPQIFDSGGQAVDGTFFCNHYNNESPDPAVKNFLSKWQAKFHALPGTTMGALGYDAMGLVVDALKRAKTLDSKGLMDALADTADYKAVTGDIALRGQNGNPPKRALVVRLDAKTKTFKFAKAYEWADIMKSNGTATPGAPETKK